MAATKTLNFDQVVVGGVVFDRHLMETATIDITENETAISNNQKEPSSYDVEFSVALYNSEALLASSIYRNAADAISKTSIAFQGGEDTATLIINDVVVNLVPNYEDDKAAYVLSGRKRGLSASEIVEVTVSTAPNNSLSYDGDTLQFTGNFITYTS